MPNRRAPLRAGPTRLERASAAATARRWPTRCNSPGKRVRAALVLAAYRSVGGASTAIAGVAAAVETVHAYSLVHDDLPCMDDDDLRRGRPTTHRAFDVPTATASGSCLVPVAAGVLRRRRARARPSDAERSAAWPCELFAGGRRRGHGRRPVARPRGRGSPARPGRSSIAVHRGKTGALIRASCVLGGIAARPARREIAALGRLRRGHRARVPDRRRRARRHRHERGARQDGGARRALDKSTYPACWASTGARARGRAAGGRAGGAPRAGPRVPLVARRAGQLYCRLEQFVSTFRPDGSAMIAARRIQRPRRPEAPSRGTSCPQLAAEIRDAPHRVLLDAPAATSAPASAWSSSPSRCSTSSTRRATRSCGTSATRPTPGSC